VLPLLPLRYYNEFVRLALLQTPLCLPALLQPPLYLSHCCNPNHTAIDSCTLALFCRSIRILLLSTSIILLLSLATPIAGYDPRVWVPQGSGPTSPVVLLTTARCHPTSSLEVYEHSWHNRHQWSLHFLLRLSRPCLGDVLLLSLPLLFCRCQSGILFLLFLDSTSFVATSRPSQPSDLFLAKRCPQFFPIWKIRSAQNDLDECLPLQGDCVHGGPHH